MKWTYASCDLWEPRVFTTLEGSGLALFFWLLELLFFMTLRGVT